MRNFSGNHAVYTANWTFNLSLYTRLLALTFLISLFGKTSWSQAFDLDQGENGGKPSSKPISSIVPVDPVQWVNSNLGGTNAHFMEGYSVSYRAKLTNLTTNTSYVLRIGFDLRQGSKYALDYITGVRNYYDHLFFQHLVHEGENADVLNNPSVPGVDGAASYFTLPPPNYGTDPSGSATGQRDTLTASFNALNTNSKRQLIIYGGTITDAFYQAPGTVNLASYSQLEAVLLVRFTTNSTSTGAVIGWGGHIASILDWGAGNSASLINGSPYHMRIKGFGLDNSGHTNDLVSNGGNTDRSLKTDAVVYCSVNGGTIGSNQTLCKGGDPAALTGAAGTGNGTISYRWESGTSCTGPWTAIANTNSTSYDPGSSLDTGVYYYHRVTISTGQLTCEAASNCVTITVNDIPSAPSTTYNAPKCDETKFSVTVNSPVAGGTYCITDKNGNNITGVSPSNCVTYDTGALKFSNIPAGSGYKIRVTVNGCTSGPDSCGTSASAVSKAAPTVENYNISLGNEPKVLVAPNPFSDQIRFTIQSAVSGKGSLELYNMMGQKVKTVYQGYVNQGVIQNIDYSVPWIERSSLIYIFRVGNQKTTGKLIGLK